MELSIYDFGETLLVFETRGLVGKNKTYPFKVANEFYMQSGVIKGGKFYPEGQEQGEPLPKFDSRLGPGSHFENFVRCVRNRRPKDLHADILEGHLSSALCHLGNISYRMGWEMPFTTDVKALGDCNVIRDSAMTVLENTKAIGVNPAKATYRMGPKLHFNPHTERFVDNAAADVLLSRFYREPFVVPENV
jgi:hypothetical protein